MDVDLHIGRQLRRRRRLLDMTQGQLGEACGITFQQIQKYETAYNHMSALRLYQISQALGVSPAYFFEGLEAMERAA